MKEELKILGVEGNLLLVEKVPDALGRGHIFAHIKNGSVTEYEVVYVDRHNNEIGVLKIDG